MKRGIAALRPVYVVGIGLSRYTKPSPVGFVDLGLNAIREALADAGVAWKAVDSATVGTVNIGMAAGRAMLRYLGATGLAISQCENASASGSTAFRHAVIEVASGMSEVSLAVGVDKAAIVNSASAKTGVGSLPADAMIPAAAFALVASDVMSRYGVTREDLARVAVKNHGNAAHNPYAHFQKARTLDEVLAEPEIAGPLTRLQCCPIGDGAAATIVVSEDALKRLGIEKSRAVRVLASVSRSERLYAPNEWATVELTREAVARAYEEASICPKDLDVVEVHDAFSIEEILYTEALGLCDRGEGARFTNEGKSAIGGSCAISPSGGLLAMGHPLGPTGVGQICEITRQLRGEAGGRQQPDAKVGLAHMVGIGQVCLVHVLRAPD